MNPRQQNQQRHTPGAGHGRFGGARFMREKERPKHFIKTIIRLLGFLGGQRLTLVFIFLLAIGASAAAMVGPFLIGLVIDSIAESGDYLTLVFAAIWLFFTPATRWRIFFKIGLWPGLLSGL
ncbi:MAG: hypothetical protein FWB91_08040 [Defluviitaleaceae bacterium]|nr:hypothetical protein [Defluviitaleaceae bacterium]